MQGILSFLSSTYGKFTVLAVALGVVVGFIKNGKEIRNWISELLEMYRKRRSAPEKTLELMRNMADEQAKKDETQKEQLSDIYKMLEGLDERFDTLEAKVDGVDSQVSTMQLEKMMWAYVHYGIKKHPISLATRTSLELMYDQYTENGKHNHIPQDFKEAIRCAPIEGAEE